MDHELAYVAAYAPDRRCMCSHQVAVLLWVKWRHGPILKVWRHIENPTPSISLHLVYLKNIPATNFIPIWFETMSPQHEEQQQQQEEQDD